MTPTSRCILAVQPVSEWDAGALGSFERWSRAAAGILGVAGAEMEAIDRDAQAAHTGRAELPRFVALLSLWAPHHALAAVVQEAIEAAAARGIGSVTAFPVAACTLRHGFPRSWGDGEPTPGLKKSTFWRANPDFGPGWRDRYARHAQIVIDHHSSAWQYRQNLLGAHGDEARWDAVSELWWPTPEGLIERFYNSAESQQVVREDTVFVGRAMPIVTRHTILRPAPVVAVIEDATSDAAGSSGEEASAR